MELENAFAVELSRLMKIADEASREIAANRPWWVGLVSFLHRVML